MTAGQGSSRFRAPREKREHKQRTPIDPRKAWLIMGALFFSIIGIAIAAEPSNTAGCFNLRAYYSSHDDNGGYEFGSAPDHCPSNWAPREACIQANPDNPANDTNGCDYNEKPFFWTDADLNYGPDLAADQYEAGLSLDGMPGDVQQTVCDDGKPVKVVRMGYPHKVGVRRFGVYLGKATRWTYRVTCSNGAQTITEW